MFAYLRRECRERAHTKSHHKCMFKALEKLTFSHSQCVAGSRCVCVGDGVPLGVWFELPIPINITKYMVANK